MLLLSLLLACEPQDVASLSAVTVERMGPTVARVSWTSDEPGLGFVRYNLPGTVPEETHRDLIATTDHEFIVAGMTPSTAWTLTAITEIEGKELHAQPVQVETEAIPAGAAKIGASEGEFQSANFLLETTLGAAEGVVIYDRTGSVVLSLPLTLGRLGARARLDSAGSTVSVGVFDAEVLANSYIASFGLDGVELSRTASPYAHHDFVAIPEGWAYLALDTRQYKGEPVSGDVVVEVDLEGNELRRVWSSWDTWIPNGKMETGFYGPSGDWTHANTLEYLEATDEYLISVHNLSTVIQVDRGTGAINRQIGGEDSDLTLASGSGFVNQHSPFLRGDTLYLFDNGAGDVSEVRGYQIDDAAGTYAQSWHIPNPADAYVPLLGDVFHTQDGQTLTSWGSVGIVAEFDAANEQTFRLDLSLGAGFGFFQPISALGGPAPD